MVARPAVPHRRTVTLASHPAPPPRPLVVPPTYSRALVCRIAGPCHRHPGTSTHRANHVITVASIRRRLLLTPWCTSIGRAAAQASRYSSSVMRGLITGRQDFETKYPAARPVPPVRAFLEQADLGSTVEVTCRLGVVPGMAYTVRACTGKFNRLPLASIAFELGWLMHPALAGEDSFPNLSVSSRGGDIIDVAVGPDDLVEQSSTGIAAALDGPIFDCRGPR